jgi:dihydroorotate dehydrogenase
MKEAEILSCLELGSELGLSGFVLTNTLMNDQKIFPHKEGGVSGAPLKNRSEWVLQVADAHLKRIHKRSDCLLVSVGGVLTAKDVLRRLELGADLVQVYSGLVFEGPRFFQKVAREVPWQ